MQMQLVVNCAMSSRNCPWLFEHIQRVLATCYEVFVNIKPSKTRSNKSIPEVSDEARNVKSMEFTFLMQGLNSHSINA